MHGMKTLTGFFLVLFCLAFGLNTMAQFGNVIVFAPKGEKFSVFIGGKPQNQEPAARVEADNPGGPSFKMRIVFPDPSVKEISKLTFNKPGGTMYFQVVKNAKGVYVLESTSSPSIATITLTLRQRCIPKNLKTNLTAIFQEKQNNFLIFNIL
jgi:hypothetical protein